MLKRSYKLFAVLLVIALLLPAQVAAAPAAVPETVNFTILHTNDFHGNLEWAGSNPGAARVANKINSIRTAKAGQTVLLLDAGDIMQGNLLSNLYNGEPSINYFKTIGYDAVTFGNHEFDWGQTVIADRVNQAKTDDSNPATKEFNFLAANITKQDAGKDCASSGWTPADFAMPYQVFEVTSAAPALKVGVIGVSSVETPYITKAESTAGLCFKDPFEAISRYYTELDAAADVLVVLSHNGFTDGGYGYGFTVYGDQTLASKLNTAGKPVNLIIGGHSHTDVAVPGVTVGNTLVVQAHYAGRKVGQVDFVVNRDGSAISSVAMTWTKNVVVPPNPTADPPVLGDPEDPTVKALIDAYIADPDYQALVGEKMFYTNVPLVRNYDDGNNMMGIMVNDALYNDLNEDTEPANDVDMVFNNAGGLRADITCPTYPCLVTYGMLFSVLPFGNATIIGDMTGAQIMDLLNQSATLFKGSLQVSGIKFMFYRYKTPGTAGVTWAWGAYDVFVWDKATDDWAPLDLTKIYRIATNEFLAPAGQDGYTPFKYVTNYSYWGDMLNQVKHWMNLTYGADDGGTPAVSTNPYNAVVDGRVIREGDDTTGPVVPVTILHHNDSHGNLLKGSYVGYTQLVTMINQERAFNPTRTLLVSGGDNIQGDAMMYYFKTAALGYAADGTVLPVDLRINPLIKAFNAVGYDAMTLGNHEFNFGSQVFTNTLRQADFPLLQANVYDDPDEPYGLAAAGIRPYVVKTVGAEGIEVAILGIGNHRIPQYELPSNIPGLQFTDPIAMAGYYAPLLDQYYDGVVALTHIGFTENPSSVEVDNNVDTYLATQAPGIDTIIGAHSHTDPTKQTVYSGAYKYLPTVVGGPSNASVLVTQAYRYNNTLGEVILGFKPDGSGGYEVVSRAGKTLSVAMATEEDPTIKALITPYNDLLTAYNNIVLGDTNVQINATQGYTQETNGANLQTDASIWELRDKGIAVDFHISGAMSNTKTPADGTTYPYTLKVSDMFTLMPYENSLVVFRLNGPQLKTLLERGYRNYYYYKYVSGRGGYSYYTTCMLDINSGGKITYKDNYPMMPDGSNVVALEFKDALDVTQKVDFTDATMFYKVSTVNYIAAGSCNFNNAGETLWPLDQIVQDTQYYVRDAVIHYLQDPATVKPIAPAVEGRLLFLTIRGWLSAIFDN